MAFIFAVEEINRSPWILPNITLGYQIFDSCGATPISLSSALGVISGKEFNVPNFSCWGNSKMVGLVGDLSTDTTYTIAQLVGVLSYPQISYGTMNPIFSDKFQFPSFYRTIPNEEAEMDGIVQILKHFGWKWVGLIISDDDIGYRARERISTELASRGGCLAFSALIDYNDELVEEIEKTTVNVIVLFISQDTEFTKLYSLYNLPPKLWITSNFIHNIIMIIDQNLEFTLNGSLSLLIQEGEIPGFEQFFYTYSPNDYPNDAIIASMWQPLFHYYFIDSPSSIREIPGGNLKNHTGNKNLKDVDLFMYWNYHYRVTYRVYTAVYALARALHNLYSAQPPANHWDKLESLKHKVKPWQTPEPLCNAPCAPGYRKSKREGAPSCCYDCVPCIDGEMSNTSDAPSCFRCPGYEMSNEQRTACVPKMKNYLSYGETLGASLASIALVLFLTTSAVQGVFVKYWHTTIVKANNQNLSCLLLISLMLCFLCTLLFIGRPTQICCLLRQVTFGVVFTISVSSVLAKTLTVIIAFNATKPGSTLKKFVGFQVPIVLVTICSLGEIAICIVWMTFDPPFLETDIFSERDTIILQCNEGSVTFFFSIIGYIGTLALLSFIAAFLAKDFPDRFNEAKNITFSMLGFCSVWGAFVPAYLSSKGSRMVAVEIFAILSSSAGLLGCIFGPKCYIIFLRPQLNTKVTAYQIH
uniref:G-protein coupled receptors family 3 profile domain-containing protein n=1 Tax=Xenopus tropicalis TaxID=8364 RepID=A0A1B8YAM9_XENTR